MRLYEIGGMLHTEQLAGGRTTLKSLDIVRIENYLRDIINDPEMPTSEKEWQYRLANLGLNWVEGGRNAQLDLVEDYEVSDTTEVLKKTPFIE